MADGKALGVVTADIIDTLRRQRQHKVELDIGSVGGSKGPVSVFHEMVAEGTAPRTVRALISGFAGINLFPLLPLKILGCISFGGLTILQHIETEGIICISTVDFRTLEIILLGGKVKDVLRGRPTIVTAVKITAVRGIEHLPVHRLDGADISRIHLNAEFNLGIDRR